MQKQFWTVKAEKLDSTIRETTAESKQKIKKNQNKNYPSADDVHIHDYDDSEVLRG